MEQVFRTDALALVRAAASLAWGFAAGGLPEPGSAPERPDAARSSRRANLIRRRMRAAKQAPIWPRHDDGGDGMKLELEIRKLDEWMYSIHTVLEDLEPTAGAETLALLQRTLDEMREIRAQLRLERHNEAGF